MKFSGDTHGPEIPTDAVQTEFVVMAEGEVTIREPGGIEQTFGPGDVFFVPKGTLCSWHVPTYIRKFFAAVEP